MTHTNLLLLVALVATFLVSCTGQRVTKEQQITEQEALEILFDDYSDQKEQIDMGIEWLKSILAAGRKPGSPIDFRSADTIVDNYRRHRMHNPTPNNNRVDASNSVIMLSQDLYSASIQAVSLDIEGATYPGDLLIGSYPALVFYFSKYFDSVTSGNHPGMAAWPGQRTVVVQAARADSVHLVAQNRDTVYYWVAHDELYNFGDLCPPKCPENPQIPN